MRSLARQLLTTLLHTELSNMTNSKDNGVGDVTLGHGASTDEGGDAAEIQVLWVVTRLDLNLVAGEVVQVRDDYRFFTDDLQHQLLLWLRSRGGPIGQVRGWGQGCGESEVSHTH